MSIRFAGVLMALAVAGCASAQPPPAPRLAQTYADYLVGRTANLRDDHVAAADRYFAALERSPGDEMLIEGALSASLALGDLERARRAARLAPNGEAPAKAHLVRAADALREANWSRASQELERVEGVAAEELLARMMQVWVGAGRNRLDAVLLELDPLASVRPYGGLFAYQQAMALDLAGRRQDALAAYEQGARSGMVLAPGVIRHAQLLLRSDRRDDAIEVLRAAGQASADPALPDVLARVEAGGDAVAAPLTPAQGAAIGVYGMGGIFLQEHDSDGGLVALALAQMLDPSFDPAHLMVAEAQADLGRYDLARQALDRVPSVSPYFNNARVLSAWFLLDAGRDQDALVMAQASARSGAPRAQRALADMYMQLDRYAEAEPIYSELIVDDGDNWRLLYLRGTARERTGRWPEAEGDLRRALELSPQQPEVLNYLGYSLIDRSENLEEAMAMIEQAVTLRPNSGAILDSLGWGHYRQRNFERALLFIERAVELEPADPVLNDHLGDVYWRLGRRIEARYQWRRALTLAPESPGAIETKLEDGLPALPPVRAANR